MNDNKNYKCFFKIFGIIFILLGLALGIYCSIFKNMFSELSILVICGLCVITGILLFFQDRVKSLYIGLGKYNLTILLTKAEQIKTELEYLVDLISIIIEADTSYQSLMKLRKLSENIYYQYRNKADINYNVILDKYENIHIKPIVFEVLGLKKEDLSILLTEYNSYDVYKRIQIVGLISYEVKGEYNKLNELINLYKYENNLYVLSFIGKNIVYFMKQKNVLYSHKVIEKEKLLELWNKNMYKITDS